MRAMQANPSTETNLMAEKDFTSELKYIQEHKGELVKNYENKYVIIASNEVVESFDTYEAAAQEGIRRFGLSGIFLVYQVIPDLPVNFVMAADF